MSALRQKDVLTTGDVARICHVAPRTVSKWFDSGQLRGYRIPGSRDRRIPVGQLLAFMQAHGMPVDEMDDGECRVMIVDPAVPAGLAEAIAKAGQYEVAIAVNGFDAGVQAQQFRPHVIVLDTAAGWAGAASICRNIKDSGALNGVKVIAAEDETAGGRGDRASADGFDGFITKPYTQANILGAIEQAMNLVA